MTEQSTWLYDRYGALLLAGVDHDYDKIGEILDEIGQREGHPGVYVICCAMADTVRRLAIPGQKVGDGTLSGDLVTVAKPPGQPEDSPALWAVRFAAAYVNGDRTRLTDMFFGLLKSNDDLVVAGVVELIAMTADIALFSQAELS
jgi:hypothetical protein